MASSSTIKDVIRMITGDPARRIIVVSAPGKRPDVKDDIKVTDLLIACAENRDKPKKREKLVDDIVKRYEEIACGLGVDAELSDMCRNDLRERIVSEESDTAKYMDRLKAFGEEYAARFLAAVLDGSGVPAEFVSPQEAGMIVSDRFGDAELDPASYERIAKKLSRPKKVIVFPGFYGITESGDIATFARGGSDLTGAILAAAVNAKVYENFTDVPGIFCTAPNLLKGVKPRKIHRLSFEELRELAYTGFNVFHHEAMLPVMELEKPVPIHVRDYRLPDKEGSLIVGGRRYMKGRIIGIAAEKGFISYTVTKRLMNREIGFGRRLFQIIENRGISYEHSPSGIDSISVIIKKNRSFTPKFKRELKEEIESELGGSVKIEDNLSMLAIVGLGMKESVGIAARAFGAIADAGVNIEMISQGASELSIFIGVKERDTRKAVTALYNRLVRSTPKTPYLS